MRGVILAQPRSTASAATFMSASVRAKVPRTSRHGACRRLHPDVAPSGRCVRLPRLGAWPSCSSRRCYRTNYIGLGVTEAIVHNGPSMIALAEFLHNCFRAAAAAASAEGHAQAVLSVLNTDNAPSTEARSRTTSSRATSRRDVPAEAFENWVEKHVVFHNTMVDRITSQRDGDSNVARPSRPAKALVIETCARSCRRSRRTPAC